MMNDLIKKNEKGDWIAEWVKGNVDSKQDWESETIKCIEIVNCKEEKIQVLTIQILRYVREHAIILKNVK